jgi:hypothetical protein
VRRVQAKFPSRLLRIRCASMAETDTWVSAIDEAHQKPASNPGPTPAAKRFTLLPEGFTESLTQKTERQARAKLFAVCCLKA